MANLHVLRSPSTLHASLTDPSFPVVDDGGEFVGRVVRVVLPSRIRRGRAQASPWWRAYAGPPAADHVVRERHPFRESDLVELWPSRAQAVAALGRHLAADAAAASL